MEGALPQSQLVFSASALDVLMPLHVRLDGQARLAGAGPTMRKLLGAGWQGQHLLAQFDLRRPRIMGGIADLTAAPRLALALRGGGGTPLRGVAVPLGPGGGVLVNLSFGAAVADAVRDHALSDADFAPTDLAIELLFLAEARAAVMAEIARMTRRLRRAHLAAEEQANTDALTGLNNRRAMDRRLGALILAKTPFALVHLDLDYFKDVNDTLGHAAGDRLLAGFARVLRQSVRDGDTVARVGGDEFILLLIGITQPDDLSRLGARLLQALSDPQTFPDSTKRVSASVGAVLSVLYQAPVADVLLSDADQALYRSKRAGRGRMTLHLGDKGDRVVTAADAG